MSEKRDQHIEQLESRPENNHSPEVRERHVDHAEAKSRQTAELNDARRIVAHESDPSGRDKILENLKTTHESDDQEDSRLPVSTDLKKATFNKEIKHIRHRLNKPDRLASRVIHQPFVKNVSEVSAKTITRPSGLLGGGITAFLGTSIYLYLTKHMGLKYNYSMFLSLLVAGFVLGLIIEAVIRVTRSKKAV